MLINPTNFQGATECQLQTYKIHEGLNLALQNLHFNKF